MVIVLVRAQTPGIGVKVYVVVAVLFKTGYQLPVTLFVDCVGKAFNVFPEQIASTALKVGVTFAFTVIVFVALLAQNPVVGVKI
jgi:hypothetical protein